MKKPLLVAISLAACAVVSLASAPHAWAYEAKTKYVSCGVNQRLNIVSNTYSYANHIWKGNTKAWATGGSHISDRAASGQSGTFKVEGGTIYSWGGNCYCPSGTTCGV